MVVIFVVTAVEEEHSIFVDDLLQYQLQWYIWVRQYNFFIRIIVIILIHVVNRMMG